MGDLEEGMEIHQRVAKNYFTLNVEIESPSIAIHAKHGRVIKFGNCLTTYILHIEFHGWE